MTNVMIATPCYGGQVTEPYFQSVLRTQVEASRAGINVGIFTQQGESLITRGRNNMLRVFLDSGYDQLLWIDADISFDPLNVFRLIHSDHEVTATPYPLKAIDWDAVRGEDAQTKQGTGKRYVINRVADEADEGGFAEVMDAGTGFMCIKRSALDKMIEAYPELKYRSDDHFLEESQRERYRLFDVMVEETEEGDRYLSEDYAFCRRWQKIGGKVMLDIQGPPLGHHGSYTY